jgi:hypothetical protein
VDLSDGPTTSLRPEGTRPPGNTTERRGSQDRCNIAHPLLRQVPDSFCTSWNASHRPAETPLATKLARAPIRISEPKVSGSRPVAGAPAVVQFAFLRSKPKKEGSHACPRRVTDDAHRLLKLELSGESRFLATRACRSRGRNRTQPTRSAQVLNLKGLRRGLLENPKGEQGGESDADHRQHPEQLTCRAAPS